MTSIAQQIKNVQELLRKQAERLGELNLKSNDYIEQNEKLALQIIELKNKITKKVHFSKNKKHMIEQQNKDKMLIHQKLIKAEREKQLLQIEYHRKQQLKLKQLQKQQEQMNQTITNHIQTLTTDTNQRNNEKNVTPKQKQSQKEPQKDQTKQENVEQTKNEKQVESETDKTQQTHGQQYVETDRGEYQPPMLFEETSNHSEEEQEKSENQDSDQDQEDEDILSKLRATVKDDEEEDQEKQ